ncbi:MAG TPA: Xaa-Pro peptidase family protein [Solirubrobacteraceae bacterium]|nr:Xaa-Pro peptidase family protein [Solirubrobacteraceae bacterium]
MSAPDVTTASVARADRLREALAARELDALLVKDLTDVRYLTGFTGSSALALIAAPGGAAGTHADRFFTDFRYETQSSEQVPAAFAREIANDNLLDAVARALSDGEGRLGFDEERLTVADHTRLREKLPASWELVPATGMVRALRAVKDAGEIARIRAAAQLADEAMRALLSRGLAGRTERGVAGALEAHMRELGAQAASFPTIVAAGAHAALPHAEPREEPIARDVLVTIDWGARLDGYCSDCTRTYATGEGISTQAREVYELVRGAECEGLSAVHPGPTGVELDAHVRAVIEDAGHGAHFGHGLGHGVGMEIHEAPRLSRTGSKEPLREGNVVTIEPGVYLPGRVGVRIEDLVAVTDAGADVLTGLPKELTVIA